MIIGAPKETKTDEYRVALLPVGAVLIPGGRAPMLIDRSLSKKMKTGSVIVDVCIDQGVASRRLGRPHTVNRLMWQMVWCIIVLPISRLP